MVTDLSLYELLIIVVALAAGGFVKGITGIGMPIVAIPIMAGFLGVEHAVLIIVPSAIVMNGWLAWSQRRHARDLPEMPTLLIYGCIGSAGGSWVLYIATEHLLSTLLAVWIGVYILLRFLHADMSFTLKTRQRLSPPVGAIAGIFQGATGISAPVLATYMHALRLQPGAYVFAVVTPFAILGIAQFIAYLWLGMYDRQILLESGLALLPAMIATPLGAYIRPRFNQRLFDQVVLVLIAAMGIKLIYSTWFVR